MNQRPLPPDELLASVNDVFMPAPDVEEWLRATFIDSSGLLFNPDHEHLQQAHIGVLWTTKHNNRQMRDVIGQAEMPQFQGNAWTKGRQEAQMLRWFGDVPDFVLTFYAPYVATCSDAAWCALVEHELYHCAQANDAFGGPRFRKDSGLPVFAIRGHDVEEFVGVVKRYGVISQNVADLIDAASRAPEVATANIAAICGTCRV